MMHMDGRVAQAPLLVDLMPLLLLLVAAGLFSVILAWLVGAIFDIGVTLSKVMMDLVMVVLRAAEGIPGHVKGGIYHRGEKSIVNKRELWPLLVSILWSFSELFANLDRADMVHVIGPAGIVSDAFCRVLFFHFFAKFQMRIEMADYRSERVLGMDMCWWVSGIH